MINALFDHKSARYERKALLDSLDRHELESIVRNHPAMFTETYPPRYVNNIYMDTHELTHYFDNVDGAQQRLKVRIRWYGDLTGTIEKPVLELKMKNGLVGSKKSFPLKPFKLDEHYTLDTQQELFRESGLPPALLEYLKTLKFTLLNRYRRKYFESADRKFRVTMDYDLEFHRINQKDNSFNEHVKDSENAIFELKYLPVHDDIAELITNQLPFRITKSSKYVVGVDHLI